MLLGRNINIAHGFITSANYALKIGCNVFQIFLKSPHVFKNNRRSSDELTKLKKCIDENSKKLLFMEVFYYIL